MGTIVPFPGPDHPRRGRKEPTDEPPAAPAPAPGADDLLLERGVDIRIAVTEHDELGRVFFAECQDVPVAAWGYTLKQAAGRLARALHIYHARHPAAPEHPAEPLEPDGGPGRPD